MDRYCVVLDGDLWIPLRYDGPLTGDQIPLPDLDAVRTNPQALWSVLPYEDCTQAVPGGFDTEQEAWDYVDSLESQISARSYHLRYSLPR
jgi:hypothetical protein